jgi:hypothetical protein
VREACGKTDMLPGVARGDMVNSSQKLLGGWGLACAGGRGSDGIGGVGGVGGGGAGERIS